MNLRLFPLTKQIFLLVLVFAMFGCDQDETADYNYFKVNDETYKIEHCVIIKGFEDDTSGVLGLGFYFKEIEYWPNDTINLLSGIPIEKNGVFFVGSTFSGNIEQGLYYIAKSTQCGYGYCDVKNYFLGGQTKLGESEQELKLSLPLERGELNLTIEGKNYIIEFDCLDIGSNKIKGYFTGVPLEINYKIYKGNN